MISNDRAKTSTLGAGLLGGTNTNATLW